MANKDMVSSLLPRYTIVVMSHEGILNDHYVSVIAVFPLDYLKPRAEKERLVEEAEKKIREEQEKIAKALAEGTFFKNASEC